MSEQQAFAELVDAVASGKEVSAGDIDRVCQEAGKSVHEFYSESSRKSDNGRASRLVEDLPALRERWTALESRLEELQQQRVAATKDIDAQIADAESEREGLRPTLREAIDRAYRLKRAELAARKAEIEKATQEAAGLREMAHKNREKSNMIDELGADERMKAGREADHMDASAKRLEKSMIPDLEAKAAADKAALEELAALKGSL